MDAPNYSGPHTVADAAGGNGTEATTGSRYIYSWPIYAIQILIALGAEALIVWALATSGALISVYGGIALAVGFMIARMIFEVYRNPREITISGATVRTRDFAGVQRIFRRQSLRCSARRHPFYGSYDVRDGNGQLVFRVYVWHSHYRQLCDLLRGTAR